MKILINFPVGMETAYSVESMERLLRIAFTRYASVLKQISLHVDKTTDTGSGAACRVRIRVCQYRYPEVEVEEIQPRLELAIDRAIHRADGLIRQQVRRKGQNSALDERGASNG